MIALLFLLATGTVVPASKAPPLCSGYIHYVENYQLHGRSLPLKLSARVGARLRNARRDEVGLESNSIAKAVKQLDAALTLIGNRDLEAYSPEDLARMKEAIGKYRDCLEKAPPLQHATIRLLVTRYIGGGATIPVPGANVLLELKHVGVTGKDGSLTLTVAADRKLQINTDDGHNFEGGTFVTATAGATKRVTIAMGDGGEVPVAERNELTLDEVRDDGILPYDFATFTLRFLDDDENTVAIKDLGNVTLDETELDPLLFKVTPRGRIVATKPDLVRNALLTDSRPRSLWVTAYDNKGRTFNNRVQFQVGRNRLSGYLIAMPPAPKVDIGNAYIMMWSNTESFYRRRADAHGQFDFSYIPSGIVHFAATRMVGDVEYKALADIHMDGDMRDVILSMDRQAK